MHGNLSRMLCRLGVHSWGPSTYPVLMQCQHCYKLSGPGADQYGG